VPISIKLLGEKAASTLPRIEQVLIGEAQRHDADEYERRLFLAATRSRSGRRTTRSATSTSRPSRPG
jgi:glutamate synthase domain-containing protein 1